jgi:hypothetical protein
MTITASTSVWNPYLGEQGWYEFRTSRIDHPWQIREPTRPLTP